jgi:hypothetical protein
MSSATTSTNINGKGEKIQMMQSTETPLKQAASSSPQQLFQLVLLNLVQRLLQL